MAKIGATESNRHGHEEMGEEEEHEEEEKEEKKEVVVEGEYK